ncbi:bifunctional RNase H/acid phosphatase [Nonomuraea antimicrobica]|uniref:Bifunctional RNase H/acid phosphatase n=1 Tax=Nonomuraea antimicrobica TaxID=561173 RepID=A0ABP7BCU2_9ACTN
MTSYVIEADGGSRGNPGPAGYGAVVKDASDGQVLAEAAEAIGVTTNNVAEYRGLIAGLRAVLDLAGDGARVAVRMDSKLVVEQMAGRWKVKHEGLRPLAAEAGSLVRRLRVTEWTWIPRERNQHADRLANEAMDAAAKGLPWKAGGPVGSAGAGEPGGAAAKASTRKRSAAQQTDLLDAGDISAPTASVATAQQTGTGTRAGTREGSGAGLGTRTGSGTGTGWAPPTRVATSLLLLRHGETELSLERRFSGRGEAELTPNGLAQASAAAARLSRDPYRLDVIVTSPLTRARQTAQAVAEQTGLEAEVWDDLREADFGAWEGHTFTEVQRRWPAELAAWLADPEAAPPGGESFATAARRVRAARERLVERYEGKTVLAVSHVTPIKLILSDALLAPLEALYRMHLDLACLSLIEYYADGPSVVKSFNDTSHLR